MNSSRPSGSQEPAVVVGVLARVEPHCQEQLRQQLERLPGVATFELDLPGQLGLLIEAASPQQAAQVLQQQVATVPGVLACWPVFECDESQLPEFIDL